MNHSIESQIAHSTKIAKQVLLAKYNQKKTEANQLMKPLELELNVCRNVIYGKLCEDLAKEAIKGFDKSTEYQAIKTLVELNDMSFSIEAFANNEHWNLYAGTQHCHRLDPRRCVRTTGDPTDDLCRVLTEKSMSIPVEVSVRDRNTDFDLETKAFIDVDIPKEHLALLQRMLDTYIDWTSAGEDYAKACLDICGVNDHIEKIEAQLLLKELGSTDAGREVLELTQMILSKDTGTDLPKLLKG